MGSVTCGDSLATTPTPGWPKDYTYILEQAWPSERISAQVLVLGNPSITSRRAEVSSSCSSLPGFATNQRFQLLNQLLKPTNLSSRMVDTLHYTTAAAFPRAVVTLVESHKRAARTYAATLAARSYLTPAEAATAMPTFSVSIDDQRNDKSQPLPTSFGPGVNLVPYKPGSDIE